MSLETLTLTVDEGASYSATVTWQDSNDALVNLTGYTASMPIVYNGTTVLTLTHSSGLTLGGAAGTIVIALTSTQTDALERDAYSYDLDVTSGGGTVTRLLSGKILINRRAS